VAQSLVAGAWRPILIVGGACMAGIVIVDVAMAVASLSRPSARVPEAVPPSQPAVRDHAADLEPQNRSTGAKPPSAARAAAGLLLFDANGDGVEDLVGVFESEDSSEQGWWLGVVSGTNGAPLWSVAAARDAPHGFEQTLRAIVGDALVVVEGAGVAQCFDVRSGRRRWMHDVPVAVNDICAGRRDVGFRAAGGALVRLDIASGAPATPLPSDACVRSYTTTYGGRDFSFVEGAEARDLSGPASASMTVERGLVAVAGGARVLLGTERANGVEAVAAVADGRLLWLAPWARPCRAPRR
jgi:hypothetical protein